ncbi:hypothetical protein ACFVAJ_17405 [Agromyces sp. NPDC057679]|uniref:hypothetical protein n=1 Tax=Agromyces sp. NPDC057679 TaxID=3346207 RepID=UPI00366CF18B
MSETERLLAMREKYADLHPYEWDDHAGGWVIKGIGPNRVWVTPLLFTFAVIVGEPDALGYTDRWCYNSSDDAVRSAETWEGPYPGSEPTGWHRHPDTGRRREHGDPACETVSM